MTNLITITPITNRRTRDTVIDKARGLAILLMIVDHVCIVANHGYWLRHTITRLAMPLFFVISGHLVKRISWRTFAIGIVGLAIPQLVYFSGNINVLTWYSVGAIVVYFARKYPPALYGVTWITLTISANFYFSGQWSGPTSYWSPALIALMTLGATVPRDIFHQIPFWRLPEWVSKIGKYPLSIYVGHLLILQCIAQPLIMNGYYK